jgi:hypothetical protein
MYNYKKFWEEFDVWFPLNNSVYMVKLAKPRLSLTNTLFRSYIYLYVVYLTTLSAAQTEDGGSMFLQNGGVYLQVQKSTGRYNTEDQHRHIYLRENLKSEKYRKVQNSESVSRRFEIQEFKS